MDIVDAMPASLLRFQGERNKDAFVSLGSGGFTVYLNLRVSDCEGGKGILAAAPLLSFKGREMRMNHYLSLNVFT